MDKPSISILRRAMLVMLCCFFGIMTSLAQNRVVSGNVVDENGEPMIGVTIQEKGTSNKTVTDLDGNFKLKPESANPVLEFSYIGSVNSP